MKKIILTFGISLFAAFAIHVASTNPEANLKKITNISNPDSLKEKSDLMESKINKTEQEWKNELTPEEYYVLREKGTERAYTGEFWNHFEDGVYKCSGCGEPLFSSETKFNSHCGWPSYFQPIDKSKIIYQEDRSYGMIRTEVMCARCGGHLGHVFDDGPKPTGLRYCINSVSLDFEKAAEKK